MSKEQVAHFIKAVAEKQDLNKKAAGAGQDTSAWVELGNSSGFEFSSDDFIGFVSQVTGNEANEDNAVAVLMQGDEELSEAQLDEVAGGVGYLGTRRLNFSPALFTQISSSFDIGNFAASFVKTSGPTFVKSGSQQGPGPQF